MGKSVCRCDIRWGSSVCGLSEYHTHHQHDDEDECCHAHCRDGKRDEYRRGWPPALDFGVGGTGLVLLLEGTRRAVGWPMAGLAVLFIAYAMLGPHMPEVLQHKGASLNRLMSHLWLTTEGVYGVALGVSVQFIFLFVLFGTLLDIAGAGNYMLQVSLALLGHLRGGPAKVAVVSSFSRRVLIALGMSRPVASSRTMMKPRSACLKIWNNCCCNCIILFHFLNFNNKFITNLCIWHNK